MAGREQQPVRVAEETVDLTEFQDTYRQAVWEPTGNGITVLRTDPQAIVEQEELLTSPEVTAALRGVRGFQTGLIKWLNRGEARAYSYFYPQLIDDDTVTLGLRAETIPYNPFDRNRTQGYETRLVLSVAANILNPDGSRGERKVIKGGGLEGSVDGFAQRLADRTLPVPNVPFTLPGKRVGRRERARIAAFKATRDAVISDRVALVSTIAGLAKSAPHYKRK